MLATQAAPDMKSDEGSFDAMSALLTLGGARGGKKSKSPTVPKAAAPRSLQPQIVNTSQLARTAADRRESCDVASQRARLAVVTAHLQARVSAAQNLRHRGMSGGDLSPARPPLTAQALLAEQPRGSPKAKAPAVLTPGAVAAIANSTGAQQQAPGTASASTAPVLPVPAAAAPPAVRAASAPSSLPSRADEDSPIPAAAAAAAVAAAAAATGGATQPLGGLMQAASAMQQQQQQQQHGRRGDSNGSSNVANLSSAATAAELPTSPATSARLTHRRAQENSSQGLAVPVAKAAPAASPEVSGTIHGPPLPDGYLAPTELVDPVKGQFEPDEELLQSRPLRKGKWTIQEEQYTFRLIHDFGEGLLGVTEGTTLRSHLARSLRCDPMRITKKFAGRLSIGKQVYRPLRLQAPDAPPLAEQYRVAQQERDQLRREFLYRVRTQMAAAARRGAANRRRRAVTPTPSSNSGNSGGSSSSSSVGSGAGSGSVGGGKAGAAQHIMHRGSAGYGSSGRGLKASSSAPSLSQLASTAMQAHGVGAGVGVGAAGQQGAGLGGRRQGGGALVHPEPFSAAEGPAVGDDAASFRSSASEGRPHSSATGSMSSHSSSSSIQSASSTTSGLSWSDRQKPPRSPPVVSQGMAGRRGSSAPSPGSMPVMALMGASKQHSPARRPGILGRSPGRKRQRGAGSGPSPLRKQRALADRFGSLKDEEGVGASPAKKRRRKLSVDTVKSHDCALLMSFVATVNSPFHGPKA